MTEGEVETEGGKKKGKERGKGEVEGRERS